MPRVVRHKHWPEDHPFYDHAQWHNVTMRECDEAATQFNHGHPGQSCVKHYAIASTTSRRKDGTVITQKGEPSKVATCSIISSPEHGLSFEGLLRYTGTPQKEVTP